MRPSGTGSGRPGPNGVTLTAFPRAESPPIPASPYAPPRTDRNPAVRSSRRPASCRRTAGGEAPCSGSLPYATSFTRWKGTWIRRASSDWLIPRSSRNSSRNSPGRVGARWVGIQIILSPFLTGFQLQAELGRRIRVSSVILSDLHLFRPRRGPSEANPVLHVDRDGVLALPITLQSVKAVRRRKPEIPKRRRVVKLGQPPGLARTLMSDTKRVSNASEDGEPRPAPQHHAGFQLLRRSWIDSSRRLRVPLDID